MLINKESTKKNPDPVLVIDAPPPFLFTGAPWAPWAPLRPFCGKSEHDALPLCTPGPGGRAGLPRAPGAESGLLASGVY